MTEAWIPILIFGLPFLGMLVLSAIYKGGTSASTRESPSTGEMSESLDYGTTGYGQNRAYQRSAELDLISRLSGHVSPGAISRLSGPVSPGAISKLSGWRPPGAISLLSRRQSPGAIARLSGHKSPGAISSLSAPRPVGATANLSAGFFVSNWIGLPLLTRSQAPLEPDETLLTSDLATAADASIGDTSTGAQRSVQSKVGRSTAKVGSYGSRG